jgi:hypothetical protein
MKLCNVRSTFVTLLVSRAFYAFFVLSFCYLSIMLLK